MVNIHRNCTTDEIIITFMVKTNGLADEHKDFFCQQSPAVRNYAWLERLRLTTMKGAGAVVRSGVFGLVFVCPTRWQGSRVAPLESPACERRQAANGAWEQKQMLDQLIASSAASLRSIFQERWCLRSWNEDYVGFWGYLIRLSYLNQF